MKYSLEDNNIKVTDNELGNEVEYDYDDMDQITEVRRISRREMSQQMKYVRDLMGDDRLISGDTASLKLRAKGRLIERRQNRFCNQD